MESIKQSMAEMVELFHTKMAEFQGQIEEATPGNPTVTSLAGQFSAFRTFILKAMDTLQKQVEFLSQQVDGLETRSRRKILLFHGVAEAVGEDTSVRVIDLLRTRLKSDLTTDDIARSQRLGRPRANQTRGILVKFRDITKRDAVWFGKTALKGSGVIASEFLTKPRHDVFMAARERFGVRNCYTRDGSVYVVAKDGERRCVSTRADLERIKASQAPTEPRAAATASSRAAPAGEEPGKRVRRQAPVKDRF